MVLNILRVGWKLVILVVRYFILFGEYLDFWLSIDCELENKILENYV